MNQIVKIYPTEVKSEVKKMGEEMNDEIINGWFIKSVTPFKQVTVVVYEMPDKINK